MTLITNKASLRLTLEHIAADLRHAYSFLVGGNLVPEGYQNVAGLIARQIRRIEDVIGCDDATASRIGKRFYCPLQCGYFTGATGPDDISARNAVALHLQRLKHGLSRQEALKLARTVDAVDPVGERVTE